MHAQIPPSTPTITTTMRTVVQAVFAMRLHFLPVAAPRAAAAQVLAAVLHWRAPAHQSCLCVEWVGIQGWYNPLHMAVHPTLKHSCCHK